MKHQSGFKINATKQNANEEKNLYIFNLVNYLYKIFRVVFRNEKIRIN